jgi:hypothetical protein
MMSPDKVVWNCSAFELKPEISSKLYQPLTISEEPSGSPIGRHKPSPNTSSMPE